MKYIAIVLFCSSVIWGSGFETQTPDSLLGSNTKSGVKTSSKSAEFVEEDAIHKPDPLLESLKKEKKSEPTLLEKIFLQNQDKKQKKQVKKVFKKPLENGNEVDTPDPLLDEI